MKETMTWRGSRELADKIKEYWKAKGYIVETTIIPWVLPSGYTYYLIRSDLVNGLPSKPEKANEHVTNNKVRS